MFHSQVTHVLVRCEKMADGTIALGRRSDVAWGAYDFITLWTLAKDVLRAGCSNLTLHSVYVEEDSHSTVTPAEIDVDDANLDSCRRVWPNPFKRRRTEPREPRLDDGARPKKVRRSATKGITVVPPAQLSLLAAPLGAAVPAKLTGKGRGRGSGGKGRSQKEGQKDRRKFCIKLGFK